MSVKKQKTKQKQQLKTKKTSFHKKLVNKQKIQPNKNMKQIILDAIKNAVDLNKDGKIDEGDLLEVIKMLLPLIAKAAKKQDENSK